MAPDTAADSLSPQGSRLKRTIPLASQTNSLNGGVYPSSVLSSTQLSRYDAQCFFAAPVPLCLTVQSFSPSLDVRDYKPRYLRFQMSKECELSCTVPPSD